MDIIISIIALSSAVLAIGMILYARWDANKVIEKLYREEFKERNDLIGNEIKDIVGNIKKKETAETSTM